MKVLDSTTVDVSKAEKYLRRVAMDGDGDGDGDGCGYRCRVKGVLLKRPCMSGLQERARLFSGGHGRSAEEPLIIFVGITRPSRHRPVSAAGIPSTSKVSYSASSFPALSTEYTIAVVYTTQRMPAGCRSNHILVVCGFRIGRQTSR